MECSEIFRETARGKNKKKEQKCVSFRQGASEERGNHSERRGKHEALPDEFSVYNGRKTATLFCLQWEGHSSVGELGKGRRGYLFCDTSSWRNHCFPCTNRAVIYFFHFSGNLQGRKKCDTGGIADVTSISNAWVGCLLSWAATRRYKNQLTDRKPTTLSSPSFLQLLISIRLELKEFHKKHDFAFPVPSIPLRKILAPRRGEFFSLRGRTQRER